MVTVHLEPKCGAVAGKILDNLPEWFGLPAAVNEYVEHVQKTSGFVARNDANQAVGFLSITPQTKATSEILVMGVDRKHHRKGIGTELLATAEAIQKDLGIRYLSVKTLAPTHPDPFYDKTRSFYAARGFDPIEIFPTLWGPENPCLLMIKQIG